MATPSIEKKNYSFYMLADFDEKLDRLQQKDTRLKSLSRSQALYLIVTELVGDASLITLPEDQK